MQEIDKLPQEQNKIEVNMNTGVNSVSSNENKTENQQNIEVVEDDESTFGEGAVDKKESVFQRFCEIVKEPVFIFTCISITSLLFISTAIIFWGTDYCTNVLHGDHKTVLEGFVLVSISGPVLGIIVGGAIVQKYAGGYEGKNSIMFALLFALLAFASALPFRYMETAESFSICLWGVLFFGGCVIPNLQGIMISSLKNDLRAAGNSVSNILQNLLGFLPAPVVYGFIYEKTKKSDPKAAMTFVLYYSIVGITFGGIAMYYRNFKKNTENLVSEEIQFEQNDNKNEKKFNFEKVNKHKESNEVNISIENKVEEHLPSNENK